MPEPMAELLDVARDHVGDSLRAVATYQERLYEFHHLRGDIDDSYSAQEIERVFDNLVLSGLTTDYLEEIFHAGRIECTMYGFEAAAMFHFVTGEASGVFLTFDRDIEVNLDAFVSDCRNALGEVEFG